MKKRQSFLTAFLMLCILVGSLGLPGTLRAEEQLSIVLEVDASAAEGGSLLVQRDVTVAPGTTALTVLSQVLGEDVHITDGYVAAIQGVREFAGGPTAGWLYDVNGHMPDRGAGDLVLEAGDRVRWYYANFAPMPAPQEEQIQTALHALETYVSTKTEISDWHAIAFRQHSGNIPDAFVQGIFDRAQAATTSRKLTDIEKSLMALYATGRDQSHPTAVALWQRLITEENLEKQGLNGLVFAILAANSSVEAQGTLSAPDDWVMQLLAHQNDDGSFALETNLPGDVDVTAMALQALAPYTKTHAAAVEKALAYLSAAQLAEGDYQSDGRVNCESNAQVLLALQALGIDPLTDQRFIKNDNNLLSRLLRFQRPDGSFSHLPNGDANTMATEQAHLALVALNRQITGQGPLFRLNAGTMAFRDGATISPWARDAVEKAALAGLIAGYEDGSFKPQAVLNRAEMVVLLSRVQNWSIDSQAPAIFADVPADAWYANVVSTGAKNGKVAGITSNYFAPDMTLNRQTMAAFVMRDYPFPTTERYFTYEDLDRVAAWAESAVQKASNAGLMGSVGDNRFAPLAPLTREQAAAVLWRLHEQLQDEGNIEIGGEAA